MTLRKEWREAVDDTLKKWIGECDCPKCGTVRSVSIDCALRLQALADKERREAFEAGIVLASGDPRSEWDKYEKDVAEQGYADYLKSQEEV